MEIYVLGHDCIVYSVYHLLRNKIPRYNATHL